MKKLQVFLLIAFFTLISSLIYFFVPVRHHWSEIFRPAVLNLVNLRNPYQIQHFYNPPWALLPIIPFVLLPERIGNALYSAFSLFSLGFVLNKLNVRWYLVIAYFLLPQTLYTALQVNIDWLVAIGFLLPAQFGLFFVLLKPQIGVFLAIYWFVEALKNGGVKKVVKIFSPVAVTFLLSFLIFGIYFTKSRSMVFENGKTMWPFSLPFGMVMLITAIKHKDKGLAMFSSPLLSPYFQPYSFPIILIGILNNPFLASTAMAGLLLISFDTSQQFMLSRLISIFIQK